MLFRSVWLAEFAAYMPPVQRNVGDPAVILNDMAGELTDPLVRRIVGRPDVSHPLLLSLIDGEPYEEGTARSAALLEKWRSTFTIDEPDLVLRLVEPEDLPHSELDGPEPDAAAQWRLEVLLQSDGEAPQPASAHVGVRKLGEAFAAYPPLTKARSDERSLDRKSVV